MSLRRYIALAGALIIIAGSAEAATIQAAPGGVAAALKTAKPGDTIVAAPGAHGGLSLAGLTFSPPVTITGPGAVFSGLSLNVVNGLNLVGVEFSASCGAGLHPLTVWGSKNLRFEALNIHGDTNCWSALLLRESSGIVVTKSEIHDLGNGISRINAGDVTISDNFLHHLASDAINGGGGSNITVIRNRITDFRPAAGAHPDGIQFWTTGATAPASNILVQDNVIDRGAGDMSTVAQGIFIELNSPTTRWSKVRVIGNTVVGGMYNGIFADGVDGLEVAGNTVVGFPDMESWIRIAPGNTSVSIHDNSAQRYIDGSAELKVDSTNKVLKAVKDNGVAILAALTSAAPAPAVDPRDTQIAELTVKVAALGQQLATASATLSAARAQAAALNANLAAVAKDRDQGLAALAAIKAQAVAALPPTN